MAFTSAQLKAECQADSTGIGLAAPFAAADDSIVAALLNQVRAGISVKRIDVTPVEVLEAIDVRDFPAAPSGVNSVPLAQSWLESITQFATIRLFNDDGSQTRVKSNLDRLVGNGNNSQTRLNAVGVRTGSRAEQLWGTGTVITTQDVTAARNS